MSRQPAARQFTPDRRALLAAEYGPAARQPRAAGGLRLALVYPNTYRIGMSSLGFQIACQVADQLPGVSVERFFSDTFAQGSIESGTAAGDFDAIAFSAAFELDGVNVLEMLAAAGLPLAAAVRGAGCRPLVLMGGVLVAVNRLPLYPFIDLFLHGEAEVILPGLLTRLAAARERGLGRAATLESLAGLPGVEITAGARAAAGLPLDGEAAKLLDRMAGLAAASGKTGPPPSLAVLAPSGLNDWPRPAPPAAALLNRLDAAPGRMPLPGASGILTPHAEFADMGLIDLARGCPHRCTFCWIGHNAPPYRVRPLENILAAVDALAPHTRRIGLVASAVAAHPRIDELCAALAARGIEVSCSSLRAEEVTPAMLRALAAGGQRSVTIAPEAGAQRVRRLLGKRLSDARILEIVGEISELGIANLKLYFMIGVPTETDDEALEVAALTAKIREAMLSHARARGRMGGIAVNLGIFVPKPGLPLLRLDPVPLETVKARLRRLTAALARIPNTRVAAASPDLAQAQAVLALGGIETGVYLRLAHALGAAGQAAAAPWRRANREWRKARP